MEAANGVDVAEHLRTSMVDIVILDLGMAQRTGLNQADILSNRPELGIIATYTQPSDLACAANFNVIASFAKPVGAEELLSVIGQILAE
jgi:DNA-binding NarL/FixJ family response regulator